MTARLREVIAAPRFDPAGHSFGPPQRVSVSPFMYPRGGRVRLMLRFNAKPTRLCQRAIGPG